MKTPRTTGLLEHALLKREARLLDSALRRSVWNVRILLMVNREIKYKRKEGVPYNVCHILPGKIVKQTGRVHCSTCVHEVSTRDLYTWAF
jgi:hypothetical protein